jgi:hypothetical protein
MAEKFDTPAAANNLRKRIKALMDHAIDLNMRKDNPAAAAKPYRLDTEGFHTWDEARSPASTRCMDRHDGPLAMTLMLYSGAARADAVRLGWGNVKAERLSYRRQKTVRSGGVTIDIPLHPALFGGTRALPDPRLHLPSDAAAPAALGKGPGNGDAQMVRRRRPS